MEKLIEFITDDSEKNDLIDLIDYSFDELLLAKDNWGKDFVDQNIAEIFWFNIWQ